MKIFNKTIPDMYAWAIFLISLLAVIESILYNQIPWNLLVSVIVSCLLDVSIKKFYLKREIGFPYSATITGLIIGSVAPFNSSVLLGIVAAVIAISSKFFLRIKNINVFNPAALGLLVSLFIFSQGDQWWVANGYNYLGFIIPLSIILVIPNYKANKLVVSIPFLLTFLISDLVIAALSSVPISLLSIIISVLQLNYFFGFIMVSEPKTSPYKRNEQLAFGILVAVAVSLLSFFGVTYSLLISLLFGNVAYALWRKFSIINVK